MSKWLKYPLIVLITYVVIFLFRFAAKYGTESLGDTLLLSLVLAFPLGICNCVTYKINQKLNRIKNKIKNKLEDNGF